uniref:Uncharacterized protein n=1 Tax=Acrobeloides nanus TaxID=290746 RepID=A0A914DY43_9BILA
MLHPKGCFVDEKDLAPGETFNNYETNSYHECYRTDGRIGYRENFCGYLNPCHQFPESEKQKFQPKQGLPLRFVYSKVEEIPLPMDGERPSGIIP